jgi:hypothetical protein
MAAIPMLRRNVELEISAPAICAALARQLHTPNNFTFGMHPQQLLAYVVLGLLIVALLFAVQFP